LEVDRVTNEDGVVELWLKTIECVVVRRCWLFAVVADDSANGGCIWLGVQRLKLPGCRWLIIWWLTMVECLVVEDGRCVAIEDVLVFGDLRWLDFWGLSMIGILVLETVGCGDWCWFGVVLLKIVGVCDV
jgi:hypothetical protein